MFQSGTLSRAHSWLGSQGAQLGAGPASGPGGGAYNAESSSFDSAWMAFGPCAAIIRSTIAGSKPFIDAKRPQARHAGEGPLGKHQQRMPPLHRPHRVPGIGQTALGVEALDE